MNTWSDKLIELSREYLNYDGIYVKSLRRQFGKLYIDYENSVYTIKLFNSNKIFTFNSVDEIINSGWVVD